ncbi:hypothetical protein JCM12681A_05840 [Streptomyces mexicanus]
MGRPGRRTWVCPHCFRRVGRDRLAYACPTAGCDGRGLTRADPLAGTAVCGGCGRATTRLCCTACGNRLPEGYLRTPGRLVALAGPVGSGKSTYIGVLVHELLHGLGAELDAALVPCDDDTMADYHERYERHLYDARHTVPKTAEHDGGRPLVHRLARTRRGRWGRRHEEVLTLVFLDTAGEHFASQERLETELRYLAAADAVIVLVDPLDLPGAPLKDPGADGAPGRSGEVLVRVLNHLRSAHGVGGADKLRIPVAVALTKADLLWPHLPENSALHRTRRPGPVFRRRRPPRRPHRAAGPAAALARTPTRPASGAVVRRSPVVRAVHARHPAAGRRRPRPRRAGCGRTGSRTRCCGCCTGSAHWTGGEAARTPRSRAPTRGPRPRPGTRTCRPPGHPTRAHADRRDVRHACGPTPGHPPGARGRAPARPHADSRTPGSRIPGSRTRRLPARKDAAAWPDRPTTPRPRRAPADGTADSGSPPSPRRPAPRWRRCAR